MSRSTWFICFRRRSADLRSFLLLLLFWVLRRFAIVDVKGIAALLQFGRLLEDTSCQDEVLAWVFDLGELLFSPLTALLLLRMLML